MMSQPNNPYESSSGNAPQTQMPPYTPHYAYAVPYAPKPIEPLPPVTKKDRIFRILTLVACILLSDFVLFEGFHLGFSLAGALLIVLSMVYLLKQPMHVSPFALLCLVLVFLQLAVFSLHSDNLINFLGFFMILIYLGIFYSVSCGTAKDRTGSFQLIADGLYAIVVVPFRYFSKPFRASRATQNGKNGTSPIGRILLGCLIALPVLLILIPLLAHADAAFDSLLGLIGENIFLGLFKVIVGIILSFFVFAFFFALKKGLPKPQESASVPSSLHNGDPVMVNAFLSVISAVFLIYLFSQLSYFFNGFLNLLPPDYTHSQYARRGFFEMAAIAAINLVLVALSTLIVRRQEGKIPRLTRLLSAFICLFTLLITCTAFSKMIQYMNHSGLTRLRILTSCFMAVVLVVFLSLIFRLYFPRFPYVKIILIFTGLLFVSLSYADIDTVIARYNVNAYQQQKIDVIDTQLLSSLSDGVVPSLVELLDDSDPQVRNEAAIALKRRCERYCKWDGTQYVPKEKNDWRSYSLTHQQAVDLLLEQQERFVHADADGILSAYRYSSESASS